LSIILTLSPFITSTSDNGSSISTTQWDTIKTDTGSYASAVYKTDWDEEWSVGKIVATKDSITRDIKIKNDFEMTIGKEKHLGYRTDLSKSSSKC